MILVFTRVVAVVHNGRTCPPLNWSWVSTPFIYWVSMRHRPIYWRKCWNCPCPFSCPCRGGTFCFGCIVSWWSWKHVPTFDASIPFPKMIVPDAKIVVVPFFVCRWRFVKWHDTRPTMKPIERCRVRKQVSHPMHPPLYNNHNNHQVHSFIDRTNTICILQSINYLLQQYTWRVIGMIHWSVCL